MLGDEELVGRGATGNDDAKNNGGDERCHRSEFCGNRRVTARPDLGVQFGYSRP